MSVEGMKLVEMLLVQRVGTSKGLQDFLSINFDKTILRYLVTHNWHSDVSYVIVKIYRKTVFGSYARCYYENLFLFSIRLTVVVALLAKRSLLALEVRSLNPVIWKSYIFTVNCTEETKIKKGREWPIQKSIARLQCFYVLTQSLCFNYLYLSRTVDILWDVLSCHFLTQNIIVAQY